MQLAPLIEQIVSQMPMLRQVTASASVPLAMESLKTYPSACIVMPRGTAVKNTAINAINQRVNDSFAVILAVRNISDMHGAAASAEMDTLTPQLRAALIGWVFNEKYAPIEYAGYQLVAYHDGLMFWAEHFSSTHFVRAERQ